MNVYEAGLIRKILHQAGFSEVENEEDADVLLMITCSVREHAEQRALGRLKMFSAQRRKDPNKVIGVLGCMAQRLGEKLISEHGVDLVVGPDSYLLIPELITRKLHDDTPQLALNLNGECYANIYPLPQNQVTANVIAMRGCSNFCSYCIVPYVKGPERSRPLKNILEEIKQLVDKGVKEVTLLGQNILAYKNDKDDFVSLLTSTNEINGLERIRFLTSHPKDLNKEVVNAIRSLSRVCPQLHLPLQSGSNRILKLMNRHYTREEYFDKVTMVKELIPDLSLTTDIIVGFPTESEEDFNATLEMVSKVKFDFAYMFKFSPRPGTKAAEFKPAVAPAEAARRLRELIKIQNQITRESNRAMIGKEYELLIEAKSPRGSGALGRARNGKVVVLDEPITPGKLVNVMITEVRGWTPVGKIIRN